MTGGVIHGHGEATHPNPGVRTAPGGKPEDDGPEDVSYPLWINSIDTFSGAVRKAICTPGRFCVTSMVK